MKVLTEFVEVSWSNFNRPHFESLGYVYTKTKDKFLVKVADLSPNSHCKIEVECDYCHEPKLVWYRSYLRIMEKWGDYACRKCSGIRVRNDPAEMLKIYADADLIMVGEYKQANEPVECYCIYHPDKPLYISVCSIRRGQGCKYCWYERLSRTNRGENHPNYVHGKSYFYNTLRNVLVEWKESMKLLLGGQCDITNSSDVALHHLDKSFKKVLRECLKTLGYSLQKGSEVYTEEGRRNLIEAIIVSHRSVKGVYLRKDLHYLFHRFYGYNYYTEQDYYEFKSDFMKGYILYPQSDATIVTEIEF